MTSNNAGCGVRVIERHDGKGTYDDLDLKGCRRCGIGVSWKSGRSDVDVDLQCVLVNASGTIADCAYYNNLEAGKAVTHSGDEFHAKGHGIQEQVWINFQRLANVELLIFVVAAFSGGSLADVSDGRVHVMQESEAHQSAIFEMERSQGAVDIVAVIFRGADGWTLRLVDRAAERGQHFMDILPLLGEVIRDFIPNAPARQKVAFAVQKGGVLDMPQDMGLVRVGLGWDVDDGECDVDVSAVLVGDRRQVLDAAFFGRLELLEHGIRHTGDNLTGEGDGDDETIIVDLSRVGRNVEQVFFVVNIYTQRRTFAQVANPYCRVVDAGCGSELCRYSLKDAGQLNGLIVAKFAREDGCRWGFHALGLPCVGRTWKDSLPHIMQVCDTKTQSFMVRSNSWDALPSASAGAPPRDAKKSYACSIS